MTDTNSERVLIGQRLSRVAESTGLPELSGGQRIRLTEALLKLRGDPPDDYDLRVLYRMALRGLFS